MIMAMVCIDVFLKWTVMVTYVFGKVMITLMGNIVQLAVSL